MMEQALQDDLMLLRSYASHGDAGAFAELVRRYADMVFATARRVTGDPAAAEDVAQECFLSLAQHSQGIRGSLGGWLHRTSLNRSLQLLRSERSRRRREASVASERLEASLEASAGLVARVDAAIGALPDDMRALITEHFLCGRTQQQIAGASGVNQSTIQRRIEKALAALRARLKDEDSPAALAALPMFLHECIRTSAPRTLQQSLVKIGLSGVRGGIASTSMTAAGWTAKKLLLSFVAALLFAGGGMLIGQFAVTGRIWPLSNSVGVGPTIPFDQLPSAVRLTLRETCKVTSSGQVEKKVVGMQTVYDVDAVVEGKKHEFRIAENGKLISDQPG